MTMTIDGRKVQVYDQGEGQALFFLHGWGTDLTLFDTYYKNLAKDHRVVAIDFPGFGGTDEPTDPWRLDDYVAFTKSCMEALDLEDPILVGHSFGGRVAIKLAAEKSVTAPMILIGSAGVKPRRKLTYYLDVYSYKLARAIGRLPFFSWLLGPSLERARKLSGSTDYRRATPVMKGVLSAVVNEDLRHLLPTVTAPVLLLWGEDDEATPLEDALLMAEKMHNARLVTYAGAGHYVFLERQAGCLKEIRGFLRQVKGGEKG